MGDKLKLTPPQTYADEYFEGYDAGKAAASAKAEIARSNLHFGYLTAIVLMFMVLGAINSCDALNESSCSDLCEPYQLESCGAHARTATCRTPEGYVTRTKK